MTRLEKELDDIINSLLLPPRYAKTYTSSGTSYPPYNIVKVSDTEINLEMAVAGFTEDEISVVVEDGKITVSGKKGVSDDRDFIYKGIGTRSFEKTFTLSNDTRVEGAEYSDGILTVKFIYEIPEEKKPKQIPISRKEKVLLTE